MLASELSYHCHFQLILFSSVSLLCVVVIIVYDCTCATVAGGYFYARCTYYIHVVFVFVPLCFIFLMPCCEYCWSLPVTHMLLVVMLSPVGQ